jgi:hypothetical protein
MGRGSARLTRNAHNVMRKRDHALWVRGFILEFFFLRFFFGTRVLGLSRLVAPGGKWTCGLHQFLRWGRRDQTCQHPALGCGAFSGRQSVQVEQRLETLEQKFNLPA